MTATHWDLLIGAVLALLYICYVLVRIVRLRTIGWLLKLLAVAMSLIFPVMGAMVVHMLICLLAPGPRDDRILGALGLAGACGALLAYASTFARIAAHDTFPACFILLGFMIPVVLVPLFRRIPGALQGDWKTGLASAYPKWAMALAVAAVLGTAAHLFAYDRYAGHGVPRDRSGTYYLEINDRPIREITEEEYYAFSGYFVRAAASFILALYLVPALFYLLRRQDPPSTAAFEPIEDQKI